VKSIKDVETFSRSRFVYLSPARPRGTILVTPADHQSLIVTAALGEAPELAAT
jgi:hypothetical protein